MRRGEIRCAQGRENLTDIFENMDERETAAATPRTPVVKDQCVPASPAHGLSEILILLISRKAVEKNRGRMRPYPLRFVEHSVQARPFDTKRGVEDQRRMRCIKNRRIHRRGLGDEQRLVTQGFRSVDAADAAAAGPRVLTARGEEHQEQRDASKQAFASKRGARGRREWPARKRAERK